MSDQSPDGDPFVTVVVVTYNSAATVGETLSSLAEQTYPSDRYEIRVVDGGSTDDTEALADEYGAAFHVVAGGTIGACRNRGIDHADGDYVAFTDSDCAVPATWLRSHVDRIADADEHVAGVGGPNRPFPDDPPFAKLVGSLQGTVFGSGGSPQSHAIDRVREVRSVACCNVLYDTAIFDEHRFDGDINVGEDAEFHFRLSEAGYRFVFDPAIAVSHHLSPDFDAFCKKARSYGYAMARIQRRHGTVIRWYSALPSLALGGGAIAALADLSNRRARYVPLLLFAYLLVSGYATLQVFRDRRSPLALLMPVMLAAQYTYYGIGFLEGLTAPEPVPQELP
ncbi:glycosyltransferase [Haloarcula sp. CBA1130]|uniref:glycosyltransferase n=1 Tax=unclassified Haloarcula TaxID=2624677 RepID=UPI0012442A8D|nr:MULTISPECIES: glycosyltransferase [unclassified Haloarcula]KAA9396488.1 glycosyltransferase [Haloarcula sp. CBA1130]KAA9397655.1 glycosyltransferase [Haloarcula sp. CBA1129]